MCNALPDQDDMNVISVDWGGGSLPLYSLGLEVGRLVNKLIMAENVHNIWHSLGTHVAGYAGERIPELGIISGLDPAEPNFMQMDTTDALFVEVIHTDDKSIIYGGK